MAIDWSKYGVDDKPKSGIDWDKYTKPSYKPNVSKEILSATSPFSSSVLNDAKAWEAQGKPGLIEEKKEPFLSKIQGDIYDHTLGPVQNLFSRFSAKSADAMTFGQLEKLSKNAPSYAKPLVQPSFEKAENGFEKAADIAGSLHGSIAPIGGAYATGGKLATAGLKKFAPNAPKLLNTLGRGVGAGTAYTTASQGLDIATGSDKTAGDRAKEAAFEIGMFGLGDAALSGLGMALSPLAKKVIAKYKKTEPVQPTMNLTEGRPRGNANQAQTPDVIYAQETAPRGLPEPKINPTTARRGVKDQNAYAQKLQSLFDEANNLEKQGKLTPGREIEEVESLWSRMAEPTDPGLDELINLATKKRTLSPDGLTKGKSALAAGAGPNVNSTAYKGFVGRASMPETKVGFKTLAKKEVKKLEPFLKSEPKPTLKPMTSQPARQFADEGDTLAQRQSAATKEEKLNPFLENSADWKNKWTPALKRETMERNFDDIMGKDAPAMKKTYLEPIKNAETDRTHFLNANRDEVRGLNIKYKSKEDKLVQMYGEKKITLNELKSQTNDWKKVIKATEVMRNKYDDLFDTLNKALVDNGYDAIPKRKDYFPHYEEIDNMFTKLGFDIKNFELPTEIIGRTQNFKPGKNYFAHLMPRKGDKTDFGFTEGFDRYIEGASRVIHHTKNIKNLRKLENEIRAKYSDETHLGSFVTDLQDLTNNLAGKQSAVDRGIESALGRGVYSTLDAGRRKVSLNMIGYNLASALTNFIPVTHALATTNKKAFAEGMYDAIANVFKNDGFVKESKFLTRRYGSDSLAKGKFDKVIDNSMVFMRGFDRFSSNIIVRSKYQEGINKGLSHEKAMEIADDWAAKMMADRSLGQMPTYFNSKSLGPIMQFQLEVNNQLSFLLKDIPRSMNKAKTASALAQVAVYGYLLNEGYEEVFGRRVALDPIYLIAKVVEDFTNPELSKGRAVGNTVRETLKQLPFTSFVEGGRIPLNAALPSPSNIINSDFNVKTIGKELLKPAFYLATPTAGGQVKKTYEGLTAMGKNPLSSQEMTGVYQKNPKGESYLKYPIEDNLINQLKVPVFGKYSTPETEEYYGNNRRPLSPLQTKELESADKAGANTSKLYNNMQIDRRIGTLESKKDDIIKDRNLSSDEKRKEVDKIKKLIKELRVQKK